jgi:hypothetical protein
MPRKSPFDVNLSAKERQTLESMARRYTSPYCDVIRAKIILLADEGLGNDVIGKVGDRRRLSSSPEARCWGSRDAQSVICDTRHRKVVACPRLSFRLS